MARGNVNVLILALGALALAAVAAADAHLPPDLGELGDFDQCTNGNIVGYSLALADGFQEVPFVLSPAWGRVLVVLYRKGTASEYYALVTAHIHGPANVLTSAPPVFQLPKELPNPLLNYCIPTITSQQFHNFIRNHCRSRRLISAPPRRYYYNLHTVAFPNGEIRGNLIWYGPVGQVAEGGPEAAVTFSAAVETAAPVPNLEALSAGFNPAARQ
eukprot:tig00020909_g15372.t1